MNLTIVALFFNAGTVVILIIYEFAKYDGFAGSCLAICVLLSSVSSILLGASYYRSPEIKQYLFGNTVFIMLIVLALISLLSLVGQIRIIHKRTPISSWARCSSRKSSYTLFFGPGDAFTPEKAEKGETGQEYSKGVRNLYRNAGITNLDNYGYCKDAL